MASFDVVNVVNRAPPHMLAAIAVACVTSIVGYYAGIPGVSAIPAEFLGGIAFLGVCALCGVLAHLVMHRIASRKREADAKDEPLRVTKPLRSLSKQQRRFLEDVFSRGSRTFDTSRIDDRWFEELKNWDYIRYINPMIIFPDTPYRYKVTEPGWRQLERASRRVG